MFSSAISLHIFFSKKSLDKKEKIVFCTPGRNRHEFSPQRFCARNSSMSFASSNGVYIFNSVCCHVSLPQKGVAVGGFLWLTNITAHKVEKKLDSELRRLRNWRAGIDEPELSRWNWAGGIDPAGIELRVMGRRYFIKSTWVNRLFRFSHAKGVIACSQGATAITKCV